MSAKYVFVTGGVVSGLGKGITAASLGRLLKARGYRVTIQKFDPYINIDPGMMSPLQHGEVFVTDDGLEGDLDIGHYERFVDENLSVNSNVTAGKIYWNILNKERKGEYGGGTVQVIPHVTNEIKERAYRVGRSHDTDVVITEIGGTVGDIESLPFIEAIRQVATEVGRENVAYVHVTLLPYIPSSGELKSKPTQQSVKELLSFGIQPQVLVCRSEMSIPQDIREKIALFCNVRPQDVIENLTAPSLYEVPLLLEEEGLAASVCHHLHLENRKPDLSGWIQMVNRQKNSYKKVKIGLVGLYVELRDAYLSIAEALTHAGIANDSKVEIEWICSDDLKTKSAEEVFAGCDGILAEGSFGEKDLEGYVVTANYARVNNVPYFGICLGLHGALVDYARNIAGLADAGSAEYGPCETPLIDMTIENKESEIAKIRKGLAPCKLIKGSRIRDIYQDGLVYERHHCLYEVNRDYMPTLVEAGMVQSAVSPDGLLTEAVELKDHPWFIGIQFDPQYASRPNHAHPLFTDFIRASLEAQEKTE